MQKFLSNQNKLFLILSIVILQIFLLKPIEVLADLPTGNAVKDPNAILRNALPIKQVELQDCLLYTSPSPRDQEASRMPSSA